MTYAYLGTNYTTDSTYELEIQNFHIITPANSTVAVSLDTDRCILDGEVTFEKTGNNYTFNGTVSDHITINVCASETPALIYPQNTPFPIWAAVVLSICGAGVIICIAFIIYFSILKQHKK